MSDFKEYFDKLKDNIENKELKHFWLFCKSGKNDFKPIKGLTKEKIQKYIKSKEELWTDVVARVDIIINNKIKNFDNVSEDKELLIIRIYIFKINDSGEIDYNTSDTWKLIISYTKDELEENKFSLDELKSMINVAKDEKIVSDMFGLTYSDYIKAFNKLKTKRSKRSKRSRKRKI